MIKDQLQPGVSEELTLAQKVSNIYSHYKVGIHFSSATIILLGSLAVSGFMPRKVYAGGGESCEPLVSEENRKENLLGFLFEKISPSNACEIDRSTGIGLPEFGRGSKSGESGDSHQALEPVTVPGCSVLLRLSQREPGGISRTYLQGDSNDERMTNLEVLAALNGVTVQSIIEANKLNRDLQPVDHGYIEVRGTKAKPFKARDSKEYVNYVSGLLGNVRQCGAWQEVQSPSDAGVTAAQLRLGVNVLILVSGEIGSITPPDQENVKWKLFEKEIKVVLTNKINALGRLQEAESVSSLADKNALKNQAALFDRLANQAIVRLFEATSRGDGTIDPDVKILIDILRFGGAYLPEPTQTS